MIRRLAFVAGARPNFVKVAALIRELGNWPEMSGELIHTGQHDSPEMSEYFFRDLEIRPPDVNLGVGGGTHAQQTAEIMKRIEPVLDQSRPDLLIVVGDVNSTLAAALAAAKLRIPIAHVEAGLRSFDRDMPEEINRIVTDALADLLFTTEPSGSRNLLAEGRPPDRIFLVGNVMIDSLYRVRKQAAAARSAERLGVCPGEYAVVTLHRPSNVDDPATLNGLLGVLERLSAQMPVVFPIHPRTRARMGGALPGSPSLRLAPPMGYLEFVDLVANARLVLTDSGGIQEETTALGIPCLTLRENTERPITVEQGTNRLVGTDPARIWAALSEAMRDAGPRSAARPPDLWDGRASRRVMEVIAGLGDLA